MASIRILSARQIDTLPEGSHSDGGNLYLRVRETGARALVFRYKAAKKVTKWASGRSRIARWRRRGSLPRGCATRSRTGKTRRSV